MPRTPIAKMSFAKVYPLLVQKAERKGRTREEVDEVTCWLTGYDADGLERQIAVLLGGAGAQPQQGTHHRQGLRRGRCRHRQPRGAERPLP